MEVFSGGSGSTTIQIRLQPRASRTEVVGLHGSALKIRVSAPPVEGAANRELGKVLAKALGVPPNAVEIIRGGATRNKVVRIQGLAPAEVRARLGL